MEIEKNGNLKQEDAVQLLWFFIFVIFLGGVGGNYLFLKSRLGQSYLSYIGPTTYHYIYQMSQNPFLTPNSQIYIHNNASWLNKCFKKEETQVH